MLALLVEDGQHVFEDAAAVVVVFLALGGLFSHGEASRRGAEDVGVEVVAVLGSSPRTDGWPSR